MDVGKCNRKFGEGLDRSLRYKVLNLVLNVVLNVVLVLAHSARTKK